MSLIPTPEASRTSSEGFLDSKDLSAVYQLSFQLKIWHGGLTGVVDVGLVASDHVSRTWAGHFGWIERIEKAASLEMRC